MSSKKIETFDLQYTQIFDSIDHFDEDLCDTKPLWECNPNAANDSQFEVGSVDKHSLDGQMPDMIGRYHINCKIGSGGFGTVYRGYDPLLKRDVAIKIAHQRSDASFSMRSRLLKEGRAAARLGHPNIVPVYETGQDGPHLYLVSEYCPGQTLGRWLTARNTIVEPNLAVAIVRQLAEALLHAHQRRLLHRDVKPNNIILMNMKDSTGVLPFVPRLTDFGLVREMDEVEDDGDAIVGTLEYMAPEQMDITLGEVTESSDLYSLGTILFRMLTLQFPFGVRDKQRIIEYKAYHNCFSPRKYVPQIDRDLEAICVKLLDRCPVRRYQSARDLIYDLSQWQHGLPVTARKRGPLERAYRLVAATPIISGLVCAILFILMASTVFLAAMNNQIRDKSHALADALKNNDAQRQNAETLAKANEIMAVEARKQRDEALASNRLAVQHAFLSDFREALGHWQKLRPRIAQQKLASVAMYDDGTYLDRSDVRLLGSAATAGISQLFAGKNNFRAMAIDRSNNTIAAGTQRGEITVWPFSNPEDATWYTLGGNEYEITSIAILSAYDLIALGVFDRKSRTYFIEVRETSTWKQIGKLTGIAEPVSRTLIASDGQHVAYGAGGEIGIIGIGSDNFSVKRRMTVKTTDFALSQANTRDTFLVDTGTGGITAVRWSDGELVTQTSTHSDPQQYAVSEDGQWLAYIIPHESSVYLQRVGNASESIVPLDLLNAPACSVAFGPDADRLCCGLIDGSVAVYDIRSLRTTSSGEWTGVAPTFSRILRATAVDDTSIHTIVMPTSDSVVSLSEGGRILCTELPSQSIGLSIQEVEKGPYLVRTLDCFGKCPGELTRNELLYSHAAFDLVSRLTPKTELLLYAPGASSVMGLSKKIGGEPLIVPVNPELPRETDCSSFAYSMFLDALAIGTTDGRVLLSKPAEGFQELPFDDEFDSGGTINCVQFSSDGRFLAAGADSNFVWIWSLENPQIQLPVCFETPGEPFDLQFDRTGQVVVICGDFGQLFALDTQTGKILEQRTTGQSARSSCLMQKTNTLITGHDDGHLRVYKLPEMERISVSGSHRSAITSVVISPDQKSFFTGDVNGVIQIWDIATWSDLGVFRDYSEQSMSVKKLVFSDDAFCALLGKYPTSPFVTHYERFAVSKAPDR